MVSYFGERFLMIMSTIFRRDSVERIEKFLGKKGFLLERRESDGLLTLATHPDYSRVEILFMTKAAIRWRDFYYDQIGLWLHEKELTDEKYTFDDEDEKWDEWVDHNTEYHFLDRSSVAIRKIKRFLKCHERKLVDSSTCKIYDVGHFKKESTGS